MADVPCPGCSERDRRLAELEKSNAQLQAEVARLKARLEAAERAAKRQAAPFAKGPPQQHPKTPGRKAGEAHGRPGHRPPPPLEQIHETLEAPLPEQCPDCGTPLVETHLDH